MSERAPSAAGAAAGGSGGRNPARIVRAVGWLLLVGVLAYLPLLLTERSVFGVRLSNAVLLNLGLAQVNLALIAMLGAISLTFLTGCAGLISIGHAAFYAVGALAGAVAVHQLKLPFVLVLAFAGLVGALAGLLAGLPSLRVRGLYFVLSTLAIHYIAVYLLSEYQYKFFDVVGVPYPEPALGGFVIDSQVRWYYVLLFVLGLAWLALHNILGSRQGVAMMATRDNELAASAAGIDVRVLRLQAFAVSSAVAAVAGALYSYYLTTVTSEFFGIAFSIQFIAMIIIGGMGSLGGAVAGAAIWLLLPQTMTGLATELSGPGSWMQQLLTESKSQLVNLGFGAAVMLLLVFAPDGVAGIFRRLRQRLSGAGSAP